MSKRFLIMADYRRLVQADAGRTPQVIILSMENGFIRDLVFLLREKAMEVAACAKKGDDFDKGQHMAYYEVLSLIQQQVEAFGIDKREVGLENFDADRDILM